MSAYPRKTISRRRAFLQPDFNDLSLLGYWDFGKASGGQVLSFDGVYNLQGYDAASTRKTSLMGTGAHPSDIVTGGSGSWTTGGIGAFPSDEATLAMWIYFVYWAYPGSDPWLFNLYQSTADEWGIAASTGPQSVTIYDDIDNADTLRYTTALGDGWHHLVATINSSAENRLYIDGVLAGSGESSSDTPDSFNPLIAVQGRTSGAGGVSPDRSTICHPAVYTEAKDLAWVQAEYNRGAKAIQLKTDWGYQIRDGYVEGDYIDKTWYIPTGESTEIDVKVEAINGVDCKVMEWSENGGVSLDLDEYALSGNEGGYGSWAFWVYCPAGQITRFNFLNDESAPAASGNGYQLVFSGTLDSLVLRRYTPGGTTLDSSSFTLFDQWVFVHTTRRYDGLFNVYVNSSLILTATDTAINSGRYLSIIGSSTGTKLALADIKGGHALTKYLGVVPPNQN